MQNVDATCMMLSGNTLFKDLERSQLRQIAASMSSVQVGAGEVLVREGDPADRLFVIESGRLEVMKKEPGADAWHRLAVLGESESIGEVALLDKAPRSASVRAMEDSQLLALRVEALESLEAGKTPLNAAVKINLACEMARRLRHNNETTVQTLRDKLAEAKARTAMGVIVCSLLLGICCYVLALKLVSSMSQSAATTTVVSVSVLVFFALITLVAIKKSGYPFSMYGITWIGWQKALSESILYTLPVLGVILMGKWALIRWHPSMHNEPLLALARGLELTPLALAIDIAAYGLFTPIQEFIARGGIQSAFQQFLVGRHKILSAVVLANLMFSMTHIHLSTSIAILVFIPGLFWGWLYSRHQTLLGVSLSHFIVGVVAFYVIGFQGLLR